MVPPLASGDFKRGTSAPRTDDINPRGPRVGARLGRNDLQDDRRRPVSVAGQGQSEPCRMARAGVKTPSSRPAMPPNCRMAPVSVF